MHFCIKAVTWVTHEVKVFFLKHTQLQVLPHERIAALRVAGTYLILTGQNSVWTFSESENKS